MTRKKYSPEYLADMRQYLKNIDAPFSSYDMEKMAIYLDNDVSRSWTLLKYMLDHGMVKKIRRGLYTVVE